jgi:hypothetical protein
MVKVADLGRALNIASLYEWRNGKQIFDTSTAHIRKLQSTIILEHIDLYSAGGATTGGNRIGESSGRIAGCLIEQPRKIVFFGKFLYRTPATQQWRFPKLSRQDRATHCTHCNKGVQEDIFHCIWNCPQSLVVWDWVRTMLQLVSRSRQANLELSFQHVLLAEDLPQTFLFQRNSGPFSVLSHVRKFGNLDVATSWRIYVPLLLV